jgi:hypothetical protein
MSEMWKRRLKGFKNEDLDVVGRRLHHAGKKDLCPQCRDYAEDRISKRRSLSGLTLPS